MKSVFTKQTDKFLLEAKVSPDNLKLFVDVAPIEKTADAPAHTINRDELLQVLGLFISTEQVNVGVIDDIVKLLSSGQKVKERRILKGVEPQQGHDGKLLLLVKKFTGKTEVQIDSKGFAHYSDLHLFDNISKGQIVGRVYPPKPGIAGKDVFGKELPAKSGNAVKLALENKSMVQKKPENAEEPFDILVSEIDGFLVEDGGKLQIRNEFIVKENLDYHYGNIDFVGRVVIKGDVSPGLTVKARSGIEIHGTVRNAILICTQGDISIKGYCYGGDKSRLVCAGNFQGTILQEVEAEAGKDILILKEATDCTLRAQSSLLMPKGKFIGGEVFVVCGMEGKVIGNDAGKKTVVRLCSDVEMTTEFAKLSLNIESHEKAAGLIKLHLGPLAIDTSKINRLKPEHRSKMLAFLKKLEEVEASRLKLLEEKKTLLEREQRSQIVRVNFHEKFCEGVVVHAGEDRHFQKQTIKGPKSLEYKPETHTFELVELRPLERPSSEKNSGEKHN